MEGAFVIVGGRIRQKYKLMKGCVDKMKREIGSLIVEEICNHGQIRKYYKLIRTA